MIWMFRISVHGTHTHSKYHHEIRRFSGPFARKCLFVVAHRTLWILQGFFLRSTPHTTNDMNEQSNIFAKDTFVSLYRCYSNYYSWFQVNCSFTFCIPVPYAFVVSFVHLHHWSIFVCKMWLLWLLGENVAIKDRAGAQPHHIAILIPFWPQIVLSMKNVTCWRNLEYYRYNEKIENILLLRLLVDK